MYTCVADAVSISCCCSTNFETAHRLSMAAAVTYLQVWHKMVAFCLVPAASVLMLVAGLLKHQLLLLLVVVAELLHPGSAAVACWEPPSGWMAQAG